ncbi:MAG TPA: hypothetical protein PKD00_00320 [Burkholderiales bacterium]|nr:hypothetical protein [Burkholderiales bacterium]
MVQTRGAHQLKLAAYLLFTWILENNYVGEVLICNLIHDKLKNLLCLNHVNCWNPLKTTKLQHN